MSKITPILALLGLFLSGRSLSSLGAASGPLTWLLLGIGGVSLLCLGRRVLAPRGKRFFARSALATGGLFMGLLLLESVLVFFPPDSGAGVPEEWKRREVTVPGARAAYYCHGVLHVFDQNWMRRTSPFPARRPSVRRIMLLGDSLTYGQGVAEERTYGAILERELSRNRPTEVLNLGRCGAQSEDILAILVEFLPQLQPDLIIYGICLNDFLPSGVGEGIGQVYRVPVLAPLRDFLAARTCLGRVCDFEAALLRLGVKADFYDDILADFGAWQERFGEDLARMNRLALDHGLPPILAMVLHPLPTMEGRGFEIARIAERKAGAAGMAVVPATEGYFRVRAGENMSVSRWERHPNEAAHRIFAEELANVLANK